MTSDSSFTGLVLPDSLLSILTVEDAIESYCAAGLRPILIHAPIDGGRCTCGQVHQITKSGSTSAGKHPISNGWQKQKATRETLLDQRSRLKFVPNIGIVLGAQPGGEYLIAVDVDDTARLAVLEEQLGTLPPTPRCDSGRGHRLIYRAPPDLDVTQINNITGLGGEPGLDVKAEAGQVVVAPSLHASGRRYSWPTVGSVALLPMMWGLELLVKTKPPEWAQSYTPQILKTDSRAKKRAERYLEKAVTADCAMLAACGEGMRNTTLYKRAIALFSLCAGLSLGAHWSYVHDQLFHAGRACNLSEAEVRRTIESADKWVRESGAVRMPVALAEPESHRPPTDPSETIPSSSIEGPPSPFEAPVSEKQASPLVDTWQPSSRSSDGRPIIIVTTEIFINVGEAIAALRSDDDIFQREKKLVHVPRVTKEESEASAVIVTDDGEVRHQLVEGTPQICELEIPTIRERLSKAAVFQKWNEKQHRNVSVNPTDEIVGAVRKRRDWPGIRTIISVIETPTFRPDGAIVQTPGHDPVTRYLYLPTQIFPTITDDIATQANAQWALKFMNEIFHDFPYVNAAHRSVPIAAILTLIARPAILGSVPAFLFDASTRGSGKTLQTDAIATITTGRGAPRMNYTFDEVEMEKMLGGYALNGSSFICLDNVPAGRPFGGGPLDRCITARDMVDLRLLGSTKVLTLPWRAVIMATGNNMGLFGDTARRVLLARLEPQEASPERRTKFLHKDLLGWVRTQRPRLVSAALLILRAYWRCGCPNMGCPQWGSFEEWARIIPHAIVFAGGDDPMKARPEGDEEVDVEVQALMCILDQLPLLHKKLYDMEPSGGDGVPARAIITALYGMSPEWSEFEPLREAVEILCKKSNSQAKPDPITLGHKLRAMRSRIVGGKKLVSKLGTGHVMMWKVETIHGMTVDSS